VLAVGCCPGNVLLALRRACPNSKLLQLDLPEQGDDEGGLGTFG
jgi:hypothetical protein